MWLFHGAAILAGFLLTFYALVAGGGVMADWVRGYPQSASSIDGGDGKLYPWGDFALGFFTFFLGVVLLSGGILGL